MKNTILNIFVVIYLILVAFLFLVILNLFGYLGETVEILLGYDFKEFEFFIESFVFLSNIDYYSVFITTYLFATFWFIDSLED